LAVGDVELGKVRQVRDGGDAVIFSTGAILSEAMVAADALADGGFGLRVIDVHTVKPLDADAICAAAAECGHVFTLEEHVIAGGLGSAIAEACAEAGVALKSFRRIGIPDVFPDVVGDQAYLRAHYALDAASIAEVVRKAVAN
jgi:transketolase